jgi:hypothetical protein
MMFRAKLALAPMRVVRHRLSSAPRKRREEIRDTMSET